MKMEKMSFQSLFKHIYTGTFSQFVGQQFVPHCWPYNWEDFHSVKSFTMSKYIQNVYFLWCSVTLQKDFRVSNAAKLGGVPVLSALYTSNSTLYWTRALMGSQCRPHTNSVTLLWSFVYFLHTTLAAIRCTRSSCFMTSSRAPHSNALL